MIEQAEFEREVHDIEQDPDLGRAVRIIWIDSGLHRSQGWGTLEDYKVHKDGVMEVETVGLWMGQSAKAIAVAQSRDEDNGNWMAAQIIYKPCIIRKEWL